MDCQTERLIIRKFNHDDCHFVIKLLNQKSFKDNIADKGVRSIEDAINYLESGPIASYKEFGFGLGLIERKECGKPIGMSGLLKRPELDEVDIGYALLDEYAGKGYAVEAARETIRAAHQTYQLKKLAAVTAPENKRSIQLLEKLGFEFREMIQLYEQPTRYFEKLE